ncbi:MAG: hypothetical protein GY851_21805, partial [bacterium]|nr:hypothetical protein [bacterium]
MPRNIPPTLSVILLSLLICSCAAIEQPRASAATSFQVATQPSPDASLGRPLMRFPDVHGDTVVFVHGDDLWSVPTVGGVATRLTIHD